MKLSLVVGLNVTEAWQASFPDVPVVAMHGRDVPTFPLDAPLNCTVPPGPGVGATFEVSTNAVRVVLWPCRICVGFADTVTVLPNLMVTDTELDVDVR